MILCSISLLVRTVLTFLSTITVIILSYIFIKLKTHFIISGRNPNITIGISITGLIICWWGAISTIISCKSTLVFNELFGQAIVVGIHSFIYIHIQCMLYTY